MSFQCGWFFRGGKEYVLGWDAATEKMLSTYTLCTLCIMYTHSKYFKKNSDF